MTQIDRRHLVGGLIVGAGLTVTESTLAQSQKIDISAITKESEAACAYHCDFGDPARIGQMITNINNHLSVYDNDPAANQATSVYLCQMISCVSVATEIKCALASDWSRSRIASFSVFLARPSAANFRAG